MNRKSKISQPTQVAQCTQAGPVLKYRGSKWRLAPWIIAHFPAPTSYTTYIEPYFGSGAVFFTKLPTKHEIINDLSGDVVNLFRVLREQGEELAMLVALTPWARVEYEASLTAWEDDIMRALLRGMNPLEAARRFLVRCWQAAHLDLSRTTIWRHRGPTEHSSTTLLWRKLPARIAWTVERLQQAEIECRPALDLIARHNSPQVLLYVDPPYPLDTRARRQLYQHEMSDANHLTLLTALEHHQGPVVLSSYANPLYDQRLAHWQRFEKAAVAEGGGARTEVLWVKPVA